MRIFTLRLLTVSVALAQPLPSASDGARLTVSAVVLPNARCSFALPGATTAQDLLTLAARSTFASAETDSFRCGGHLPSARSALSLTQLSVRQRDPDGAAAGFVVTITP